MTDKVITKLQYLINDSFDASTAPMYNQGYWQGYNEAIRMAIRIVKDQHPILECENDGCAQGGLHCVVCDDLDIEYGPEHIAQHRWEETVA